MTEPQDDGVWRDEEKLPLKDLTAAMASYDLDGQGDETDNDSGQAPPAQERPSTTGQTGPH